MNERMSEEDSSNSLAHLPKFVINCPWSRRADREGTKMAEFMLEPENAQVLQRIGDLQLKLQDAVNADLQAEEDSPKIEVTYFKNWSDTYHGLLLLVKPKQRREVQAVVKAAAGMNIKMRGGGGYHTLSPFQPDTGNLMINTCELELPDKAHPRYKINKDGPPENWSITVSPGVNNAEIINDMIKEEVCFKSSVIIPTTTFGGMLSGGCHGVGIDQTPMSDWMISMKVVNSKGDIQTIPSDDSKLDKEQVLRAARVNLGTFGIIVEMTIKIWPIFNVHVDNVFNITVNEMFFEEGKLSDYLKKYWSLHILWIPFNSLSVPKAAVLPIFSKLINWEPENDHVYFRGINPTKEVHLKGVPTFKDRLFQVFGQEFQGLQGYIMRNLPGTAPVSMTLDFKKFDPNRHHNAPSYTEVVPIPYAIFFRDGLDFCYAYDMEFDFDLDIDDPSNVIEAVKVLTKLTKKYSDGEKMKVNRYPFTMFFEARFIARSDSILCPASFSKTHTACLEVQSMYETQNYEDFFIELASEWRKLNGVPHWQKQWALLPGIIPYLQEKYGKKLDDFLYVRENLGVDPHNLFMNGVLKKVFKLEAKY